MADRFEGKLVFVAGGTGALGKAVSLAFLDESASVAVTYRNPDEFRVLKEAAGEHAASLQGYPIDVTDEEAVRQTVAAVGASGKPLAALVNAVGAYAGGTALWQVDSEVLDRMFALNFRSGYILSRAFVPLMLKQGSGAIINVASRAAVDHGAGAAAYAASKAASVAMMDSLAADLKGTGVRANSVLPSIFDSEANRKAMPGADFAKWPKPEDIARVILFLCSDDARLIHGASVPVYGYT
jgi:NAD(P)-dependent dehydrogenase (short-subunit alcohol dehydrogenase family)